MDANILTKTAIKLLFLCFSYALAFNSAFATEYEALDHIRATAEDFAIAQVDTNGLSNITAQTNPMDTRLRLAKCEQPLEAYGSGNFRNTARTTVGIRCTGSSPWSLYVPVTINALAQVVYSSRPLIRGEALQLEDIELKEISLDQLPINYLSNIEELAGMELTRSLRSGTALTLNSIKAKKLISQGQEVVILAEGAGLQVRMSGIALKNGSSGDLIPIRNSNSGRTIEAMVVNESTVSVKM